MKIDIVANTIEINIFMTDFEHISNPTTDERSRNGIVKGPKLIVFRERELGRLHRALHVHNEPCRRVTLDGRRNIGGHGEELRGVFDDRQGLEGHNLFVLSRSLRRLTHDCAGRRN